MEFAIWAELKSLGRLLANLISAFSSTATTLLKAHIYPLNAWLVVFQKIAAKILINCDKWLAIETSGVDMGEVCASRR